jgi:methylated-DNA-protein-cysteine methyltransferase-like protein
VADGKAVETVGRSAGTSVESAKVEKATPSSAYDRIYREVRRIPAGRVATYGQIAAAAGLPRHARQVGYALHVLPEASDVPWHRVVNARGEVSERSPDGLPGREGYQRHLLGEEGVAFDASDRIDLELYRWDGATLGTPRRRRG